MIFYSILGLSAFLISLLGTRLTILTLRRRPVLLDIPSLRSNHTKPTPRGGGFAVVMALIICLLVADIHFLIVLSMLILAAISLMDDAIGAPIWARLMAQILAVTLALAIFKTPLFGGLLPPFLDKMVTGLLWVWFINLFNFMDGIDGISAAEMIGVGAGLCLLTSLTGHFPTALSVYSLIVAAAGCGFLWWNWHPAKIFLGDVGSIPIGFIIFYLLLLAATSGYRIPALILPAYYLADGSITLLKRLWQGKKIWIAHSEHYYQRAVRSGHSHAAVVRYISGINVLLLLLAVSSYLTPDLALFELALAYLAVFMLLGFFAHTPPTASA